MYIYANEATKNATTAAACQKLHKKQTKDMRERKTHRNNILFSQKKIDLLMHLLTHTWRQRQQRKNVDTDKESERERNCESNAHSENNWSCWTQRMLVCMCMCDITNIEATTMRTKKKKKQSRSVERSQCVLLYELCTQRFTSNVTFFRMICRLKTRTIFFVGTI